ncbi:MAG: hypothetical protein RJA81_888, partial [Planctomycetota bacterium]
MIYLDNAATSFPKPESVYRAMDEFARTSLANPGRSGHRMAMASERVLDDTRHLLNTLFHGESPDRWVFTLNCTDALNMAIKGILQEGDHVITTDLEHNSVSRPLVSMQKSGQISLTRIPSHDGYINPEEVIAAITPQTRLVAITHAANVLGTVQPVEIIAEAVRKCGIFILVDAAQSAGVIPIDLSKTPIDLLAFPGHKALYGPTGTGALYVGPRVQLKPWREGGTGGDSSTETQPELMPYRMEGGTPNVHGLVGLKAGLEWVLERGEEVSRLHEVNLLQKVVDWVQNHNEHWAIAGRWD